MKVVRKRLEVEMPEEWARPFSAWPPTDADLFNFMASLCRWADIDPLNLAEKSAGAEGEWKRLTFFLASKMALCLRAGAPKKSGRKRVNANALSPFYGLPLTEKEALWLVSNVDRLKVEEGMQPREACKELKRRHREPYSQRTAASTMARHYWMAKRHMSSLTKLSSSLPKYLA